MIAQLEKADSKEFAQWWAIYRNVNEDYSLGYTEQYQDIVDVPFCHWIVADGKRVGGIIHVNSHVGDLFLIPPYPDLEVILKSILPKEDRIIASNILSDDAPVFEALGFQIKESRHFMIRPTQAYDVNFTYRREAPQASQTQAIAEQMYSAFHGGVGEYGQRDVEAHQKSVENYFETIASDDLCQQASSVLFDGDKMIAACLVQPYKSHASIRFVVTHPDYRKQGIARRLMEYGINYVKDTYPSVVLAVTIGNPAKKLYVNMGFATAPSTHTLLLDKS